MMMLTGSSVKRGCELHLSPHAKGIINPFPITVHMNQDVQQFIEENRDELKEKIREVTKGTPYHTLLPPAKVDALLHIISVVSLDVISQPSAVTQAWTASAAEQLKRASLLLQHKDYKGALQQLQQAVENMVKSTALHLGLSEEHQLKSIIGHLPVRFYSTLLQKPWIPSLMDITCKRADLRQSLTLLNRFANATDDKVLGSSVAMDNDIPAFLNLYEAGMTKLRQQLSEKGLRTVLKNIRTLSGTDMHIKRRMEWFVGVSFLLLPLGIATSVYQQGMRYPDEQRRLGIADYGHLCAVRYMPTIIKHLTTMNNYY